MPLRLVPRIHRATHRIGLYLAALREHALSQGESHILAQLAASGPATVNELHQGLAHKRSTLTGILDRLADRGFITRTVGKIDRRTFLISPTAKGADVARAVHAHLSDLERAVVQKTTPADVRGFLAVVEAVEEEAHRRTRPGPRRAVKTRR